MPSDTHDQTEPGWATAKTLAEALPYIQIYDRETVVIKYGGHAMGEEAVAKLFAADAVLLKLGVHPVVVHGGGPQISRMLERPGSSRPSSTACGSPTRPTMEVAEMVLSGAINKEIANWITQAGAEADVRGVGLSGKDARLITVEKATPHQKDPGSRSSRWSTWASSASRSKVDPKLIEALIYADDDYIPVIAPIGVSEDGQTYNINADTVAGALAGALKAKRMLLLTDVAGRAGRQGRADPPDDRRRGARRHRRRRRHRRHDPQAGDRHRRGGGRASRRWSSSTAAGPTPCWWSCSPSTGRARWSEREPTAPTFATSTPGCSISTTPSIRPGPGFMAR